MDIYLLKACILYAKSIELNLLKINTLIIKSLLVNNVLNYFKSKQKTIKILFKSLYSLALKRFHGLNIFSKCFNLKYIIFIY